MTAISHVLLPRLFRKTRRYLLCSAIVFLLVMGSAVQPLVALAQFAPLPAPDGNVLPTGVERRGTLESTPRYPGWPGTVQNCGPGSPQTE